MPSQNFESGSFYRTSRLTAIATPKPKKIEISPCPAVAKDLVRVCSMVQPELLRGKVSKFDQPVIPAKYVTALLLKNTVVN
jgi:hypothetical protein